MLELSKKEARKIAVLSQRLIGPSNQFGIRKNTLGALNQIGYVQIDTISVVERAHHHKLWSRVEGYSAKVLERLEKDRAVFEYWSHAASYLPINSYRFTLPIKEENSKMEKFWHHKDRKVMARVLDRVRSEGPLMSREFEEKVDKPASGWPTWGPSKRALHDLFMEGKLLIVGRKGFQKIYDLPERWLPENIDTSTPNREAYIDHLIKRDLNAHGLIRKTEIGYLLKDVRSEVVRQIDQLSESKEVIPLKIKGIVGAPYYVAPETLKLLDVKGYRKKLRILSPFDNLLINRRRTSELFDFEYLLECYVPQKKRKFGYFGLPILWDDQLIGQIDLKADRKTKSLWVRNLEISPRFKRYDAVAPYFQREMQRLSQFNCCEVLKMEASVREHRLLKSLQ